ncbi:listerin E3 ubiquitin protein ligase 1 [Phytophthora boehmeriae]|uniref:E3 ubiquitin-protein ligase listerin n=1 Tax=Phytophthora boehmeriae TaxID=109152 RepID=A0A8T1WQK6_9STRA|nr:listerin E3 ubiquitin protein ligase 1 [Phytophthora boehmeriae]
MAKKNKQREKQEQSRASSSARAHQTLLASAGSGAAPPAFIGFASFAQSAPDAVQAKPKASSAYSKPVVQSIYDGSDHEIALALKMLAKKGAVTKIKALHTFLQDVLPPRQPQELRPMLGHFTQLYTFEMRDQNDRKVRQLLNEVLAALADKMKPRAFVPHLQRLLPYWFLAMHDMHTDVAALAKKAFETLFTDQEMRRTVMEEHLGSLMEEFRLFFTKTPDTFEGIALQPDEKEERYERCISAAVLSIDAVVKLFAENEMTDKLSDEDASCSVAAVVTSDKFMRLTTASSKHPNFTRDIVRRAMYVVLVTLCTKAKPIIAAKEEAFGKVVLGMLGDKSPVNHDDMWNAVLTFLQAFPNVWHSSPSFPKFVVSAVYPKLFTQIRHGFYGSGRSSFPTLLPLLSMVPMSVAVDPVKGQSLLYTGVLEQCWKFIESKDARFVEPPAISAYFECLMAFFSIFLNTKENTVWLSEHASEAIMTNYVSQFEKVFVSSITIALGLPEFPDRGVELYADGLLEMTSRLRCYSTDSTVANDLKKDFVGKLHTWTRQAVSLMIAKLSFVPSRLNTFICSSVAATNGKSEDHEAEQWLLSSKEVYREALKQVDLLVVDSAFSQDKNSSLAQVLEAISGVCTALPINAVLLDDEKPTELHFESHYRPVLRLLADWRKSSSKSVTKTMRIALEVMRPFFLAADEKKEFLLKLFQDCNVQFGDMAEASDIIRYGLQFPITDDGNKLWLSCGSWQRQHGGDISPGGALNPTLEALQAIWKGKLLDEFLMISLKGRLDDLDADAFAILLNACIGDLSHSPVVSPDAVMILCHFVIQNGLGATADAVVMQILTHLCELFYKLDGELPAELEVVEGQLYKLLFHLSARGSYRSEAVALWARTVRHSLKRWNSARSEAFVDELAEHVNCFLLADLPVGTVSFNTKKFAAYVKSYVQLAADQVAISVSQLVEKLDAIHLRCGEDDTKSQKLFYSRVLSGLGDVCDDEQVVDVLREYITSLDKQEAVNLVSKLVDLDVTSALTWVVYHTNSHGQQGIKLVETLESYLALEHLYESLKSSSPIMDFVLTEALQMCKEKRIRMNADYRNWVFLSQDQSPVSMAEEEANALTNEQHKTLDELNVAILSNLSSVAARSDLIQKEVEHSGDWKMAAVQYVALSLIGALHTAEAQQGEVISLLTSFYAMCGQDFVAAPAGDFFEYLQLVTRAVHEEENVAASSKLSRLSVIDLSSQEPVLSRLEDTLAPGSATVVEVTEWTTVAEYVSALAVHAENAAAVFSGKWEKVARLVITHAIAGKTETAKIVALKMQKRSSVFPERGTIKGVEEQVVLEYPRDLVTARLALLNLVSAMHASNADALQELAAHYREALLATVLCAFSESAQLKANIVTTYVAYASPSQCFGLTYLWLSVETVLSRVLSALHSTLASIYDVEDVKRLVLESFGGIESLASLFNGERYPLPPMVRVLLYILASYSGALRLLTFDASAIDFNGEDEAATEAALARVLIPKALRSALRAVFADKKGESGVTNIRMRSRKQKPQEREDVVGKLLLWDLFLQLFPASGKGDESNGEGEGPSSTMIASSLSSYVARNGMLSNFLAFSAALLSQDAQTGSKASSIDLLDSPLFEVADLAKTAEDEVWSFEKRHVFQLGTRVFFRTVVRLPAMVRSWWNDDCSRATRSWAAKYFEDHITPSVLAAELELIQKASESKSIGGDEFDEEEMTVKGSRVSREITTTYVKDECTLEMVVRVPSSYPLRSVEVECTKRIGISEDRWRRWVLQIIRVTASRDGSLLDAVMLWKRNVDKEFEGVEPCPICYSILNPKNMGLPSLPCKTCSNKYHNSCLYKWFNQSGKNKCPICQQPFC